MILGRIGAESAASLAKRPNDVSLIPMAGENATSSNAADRLTTRGKKPSAPGIPVDQFATDEIDGVAQHDHALRHCSTSATIASR